MAGERVATEPGTRRGSSTAEGAVRGREDTTMYVVTYDIPDDRRRGQVHKMLSGFGEWRQYSLFECFLTAKQFLTLQERLRTLVDKTEDRVRIYRLCTTCMNRVDSVGHERPHDPKTYIV